MYFQKNNSEESSEDRKSNQKKVDIVHDFLAYLSEQMVEMNKTKRNEISGFLKYLERTTGTEIENFTKKTLLKDYHNHSFDEILDVLKLNKKKLSGFNHNSRKDQEVLEKEFEKSREKLKPIKCKIQATDNLINQIIYRLYNLTQEQVEIIENSL